MNLFQIVKMTALALVLTGAARAQSPAASAKPVASASPLASASPVASASPTAPSKADRIKAAREEIAQRYAGRKRDAARTLADLKACVAHMREGQARREAEKAITNLESAIAKADGEAAQAVFRKAFVALGRPAKAAQAALRRCQSGEKASAEEP